MHEPLNRNENHKTHANKGNTEDGEGGLIPVQI